MVSETNPISGQSETEAKLHAVVSTAVDGIITIDAAGVVESFNPASERIFGYTADEVVGRNVAMLMPEPYRRHHDRYIRNYLESGVGKIIGVGREVVGKRKDGSVFPMDLAVSKVSLPEGRVLFTGVVRDITHRKKLERELLEISAHERQWIGRDLHDGLGQELTGIALLCGVLAKKLSERGIQEAEDAAELAGMVNQTIDHTRALVKGLCPVVESADGLMLSLDELAETIQNVYEMQCQFTSTQPFLISDHVSATHLHYIANEAVNNAVKHSGGDTIHIELLVDEDRCGLRVRDNGRGVDPVKADQSGRGMHIMKYRAQMIGGTFELSADPSGGTCVTCWFDRALLDNASEVEHG